MATIVTVIVGMCVAAGIYTTMDAQQDDQAAHIKRLESDIRHWKGIAYKAQDYENQAIHDAQMETLSVYHRMQAEVDACVKGKR
jgi:hypothetical protein